MNELVYFLNVDEKGNTKIVNRSAFDADMRMFAGKRLRMSIRPVKKTRSPKQNRYYWGCVVNFVMQGLIDLGYEKYKLDADVVHDFLREKFLQEELVNEDTGECIKISRSTTSLSTSEFMDYIAEIQKWASEFLNVIIPDPESQANFNFK